MYKGKWHLTKPMNGQLGHVLRGCAPADIAKLIALAVIARRLFWVIREVLQAAANGESRDVRQQ